LSPERALRIGVGGPVGSGKSSLIAALCRELSSDVRLGVVTNDIYTTEDAEFLRASGVLEADRIVAVQTGCCPHTAIRDDIPRKGGPGIARADLLVINKTDLAPYVGSDVARMLGDAHARRGELPVHALSLVRAPHAQPVADWIRAKLALFAAAGGHLHSSASGAPIPHHDHPHAHSH